MNTENILQRARAILSLWIEEWEEPEHNRRDGYLATANLLPAITALQNEGWGYLTAITGLDSGVEKNEIEVLYHFCAGAAVLTLRVSTARQRASVPSICDFIPYAGVFERELSEMMGVRVENAPDTSRLFLPDDWESGVYPLRKDAILDTGEADR